MYYFTYKKEGSIDQVAKVEEQKKIVYLHKGEKPDESDEEEFNAIPYSKYEKLLKEVPARQRQGVFNQMVNAYKYKHNIEEYTGIQRELLKSIYNDEDQKRGDLVLRNGKFEPILFKNPAKFQVFYIVGSSGSGKSTIALKLIKNFKKDNPKHQVYVVSKLDKDDTLDKEKKLFHRLDVLSFKKDPIKIDEFEDGSVIVFDDYESFQGDKILYNIIIGLLNDLCTLGRHKGLKIIICQHNVSNYSATRLVLQETTNIVIFPASVQQGTLKYLLQDKLGMSKEQVNKIKNERQSHYVMIYSHHPNFLLTEKEIKLL